MSVTWPEHDPDLPSASPVMGHGKITALYQVSVRTYEDGCSVSMLSRLDLQTRRMVSEILSDDADLPPSRRPMLTQLLADVQYLLSAEESEVG
jgi:hypothetical protein